jgi:NADH:ubiquinone oxidoreductase subunit E/FixJ family two-component response regulator
MPSNEASSRDVDVVVVDDEEIIREGCRIALEGEGLTIATAADGLQGLELLERVRPRVALVDLRMPGLPGTEVLKRLHELDPSIVPIVITGYASVQTAVDSMKLGAFEFLSKPFETEQLLDTVHRGIHHWGTYQPAPQVKLAPSPSKVLRSEEDALLKGLEAMEEYYEVGGSPSALATELRSLEDQADYHARQLGLLQQKGKALHDLATDLRAVDGILARHGYKRHALIQVLLDVQAHKNWLPRHTLLWISRRLGVPMARILEIATFYEAFSLTPQGRHLVQVCTGTACHVRQAPELSATVSALLGLAPGQTDSRLAFTLKEVHCLGCCALAPVVKVDDAYYGDPSLAELKEIFARCKNDSERQGAK